MKDIIIKNLCKAYDGKIVLQNFSATLTAGVVTGLMGESGSGKTTFARILLGLEKPDSGSIQGLEGVRASCIFQENRLCPELSALDNIALALPKERWGGVHKALQKLGLEKDEMHKPAGKLSGGQQRRVALARALEAEGRFVVLDEAFKGLDAANFERAAIYIKEKIFGRTTLLITHSKQEADVLAQNVINFEEHQLNSRKAVYSADIT